MDLNFKTFGRGFPLIILHGMLGSLDNWQTLGKKLAEHFMVYLVDQRNHGRSPHAESHTYPEMAEDLRAFMEANWIHEAHLIGHSMGGKTAMQLALDHPELVEKLVVVDMAPRAYEPGHNLIFEGLCAIDVQEAASREEADDMLAEHIPQPSIRQFLLKNLRRNGKNGFRWKMNLEVIKREYPEILKAVTGKHPFPGPALFAYGEDSDYVVPDDAPDIRALFPKAELRGIPGAGHWVHAEAPHALLEALLDFLGEG